LLTVAQLAKELQSVNPLVKKHSLIEMCEAGELPAHRNPLCTKGWWYVDIYKLKPWLREHFPEEEYKAMMQRLGIANATQGRLFGVD